MSHTPEWWKWKYALCENEIQCDGRTIAYSDNSIFDIKDKAEFSKALQAMALRLGWMVERANAATEMLEALKQIATDFIPESSKDFELAIEQMRECAESAIAKAEGK